jgi:hypothetical protein
MMSCKIPRLIYFYKEKQSIVWSFPKEKIIHKLTNYNETRDLTFLEFTLARINIKFVNNKLIGSLKTILTFENICDPLFVNIDYLDEQEKLFLEIKDLIISKSNFINDEEMSILKFSQSQSHGLFWDNEIRTKVFKLNDCINDTKKYDIDYFENIYNKDENVSIKTTCGDSIDCGDILRFYEGNLEKKSYTIILLKYKQIFNQKEIKQVLEINYNENLKNILFGIISKSDLEEYVSFIKSIPKGIVSKEVKNEYIRMKTELQTKYDMYINISPKVDSKNQRRVQCSIPKINELFTKYPEFIKYNSEECMVRGIEITKIIESPPRKRNKKI